MAKNPTEEERLKKFLEGETDQVEEKNYHFEPLVNPAPPSTENPEPLPIDPEPETAGPSNQPEPEPGKQQAAKTAEPFGLEQSRTIAASIVNFLSNAFDIGGRRLYPGQILEPGDAQALNDLNRIIKIGRPPLDASEIIKEETEKNPELPDILIRWEKCSKAIQNAKFTEEEKKTLIDPLTQVVMKYSFLQVGPELILLFAVFTVMAPRITPLMPGFSDFLSQTLKGTKD